MGLISRKKISFVGILALVWFFGSFAEVQAAPMVNACCVYYDTAKSFKCSVYNGKTGALVDTKLGDTDMEDTFDCSKYDKTEGAVKDLKTPSGETLDYLLDVNEIAERENFAGGYPVKFPLDQSLSQTAETACFNAPGYKADLLKNLGQNVELSFDKSVQTNITKQALCDYSAIRLNLDPKLQSELDKGVGEEQEKIKKVEEEYKYLQDASKKICCIPKKKTPDSQCVTPKIRPELVDAVNTFLGKPSSNPFPKQLSSFASIVPDTAKPEQKEFAIYFTCEEAGGASWESAYFLSGFSCQAFATMDLSTNGFLDYSDGFTSCKQQKYYCLCKKDHSTCENKTYPYLDKTLDNTTMPLGCNFDLAGKTGKDGAGSWICEYTTAPSDMKPGEYCAHLAQPKIEKENYDSFPLELAAIQAMGLKLKKTSADSVQDLVGKALKAFMGVLGSIALGMFVYGGFLIMSSAGSSEKSEKGTQILVWSALGVIIILSAYMLVKFVLEIIG